MLSNPNVSCLVISFSNPQHVDEYLAASGTALDARATSRALEQYDRLIAGDYCQPHCGAVPRLVPARPADQRRPPLPHVREGLRLGGGRHGRSTRCSRRTRASASDARRPAAPPARTACRSATTMLDAHRVLRGRARSPCRARRSEVSSSRPSRTSFPAAKPPTGAAGSPLTPLRRGALAFAPPWPDGAARNARRPRRGRRRW